MIALGRANPSLTEVADLGPLGRLPGGRQRSSSCPSTTSPRCSRAFNPTTGSRPSPPGTSTRPSGACTRRPAGPSDWQRMAGRRGSPTGSDHAGRSHRRHHHQRRHRLRRQRRRAARAGEGVVLPELEGRRSRRAVARRSQPDGRRADLDPRVAQLRLHERRLPRVAPHRCSGSSAWCCSCGEARSISRLRVRGSATTIRGARRRWRRRRSRRSGRPDDRRRRATADVIRPPRSPARRRATFDPHRGDPRVAPACRRCPCRPTPSRSRPRGSSPMARDRLRLFDRGGALERAHRGRPLSLDAGPLAVAGRSRPPSTSGRATGHPAPHRRGARPSWRRAGSPTRVRRLRAELEPLAADGGLEILVVDDGSTDGTAAEAAAAGATVVVHPENRGKGAAVRSGVLVARGRTIVFTDADLAYPPDQIAGLVDLVEEGWDVVVGSRRHTDTTTLVRARRAPGGRRPGHQPAHPGRAARPVPRHPVRSQGVPLRRGPVDLRPHPGRRLRLRRGGLPPGGAVPPLAGRGPGPGRELASGRP